MDMRHPTPPRSERDHIPDLMEADTASQGPSQDTQTVLEDPDARRVFIQQVSGVSFHESFLGACANYTLESDAPPHPTTNSHAQCHRQPDRPSSIRVGGT